LIKTGKISNWATAIFYPPKYKHTTFRYFAHFTLLCIFEAILIVFCDVMTVVITRTGKWKRRGFRRVVSFARMVIDNNMRSIEHAVDGYCFPFFSIFLGPSSEFSPENLSRPTWFYIYKIKKFKKNINFIKSI